MCSSHLFVFLLMGTSFTSALRVSTRSTFLSMTTSIPTAAAKDTTTPLKVVIADKLIGAVFGFRPLFLLAKNKARSSMVEQGLKIDVNWKKNIEGLERNIETLSKQYDSLIDSKLIYPDYYLQPFHAYDEGNLSWQAAMEVESAALTVHAPIFTPSRQELDKNGDFTLRDNFHKNMCIMFAKNNFKPSRILDIGCR